MAVNASIISFSFAGLNASMKLNVCGYLYPGI
jgi:hypothetical protein